MVERLFLAVPRGCLRFVILVFPDHTHLLFLKEWKINISKIIDTRISFHSRNTHLLPLNLNPKSSFRHLKRGIQDCHMNYVLVPADKAANNVVVV